MRPALYSETSGAGDAAPLVLLHGWGMNLRVFDGLRAALAAQHRVIAIDLPGHGRSPWTAGSSPQQQLDALAAMLPRGATLVGWSLGGQLALQLASDPALAVRRLVLIATSPRFVRADDWPHGIAAATLHDFAARLERDAGTRRSPTSSSCRYAAASMLPQCARRCSGHCNSTARLIPRRCGRDWRCSSTTTCANWRGASIVPALVIAGQYDRVTPPQAAQALAQLIPRSQLLQIKRAGHAPFISHAQQVGAALLGFMRDDRRPWRSADSRVTP